MKPTITEDGTHAYLDRLVPMAILMVLFTPVMHGQELPNAPQPAVKHQTPPVRKERSPLATPRNPDLGSADWFRERGILSCRGLYRCSHTLTGALAMTSQRRQLTAVAKADSYCHCWSSFTKAKVTDYDDDPATVQ